MRTAVVTVLVLALVGLAYWMLGTDGGPGPRDVNTIDGPDVEQRDPNLDVLGGTPAAGRSTVERIDAPAPAPAVEGTGVDVLDDMTAYGIVTYADDTPAEDIEVSLVDSLGELWDFDSTDEEGRFQLAAGEALSPGWSVVTEQTHFEETEAFDAFAPDFAVHPRAHAPGDPAVAFHLRLLAAPRVRGRVIDARLGTPIEAAEVYLATARPGFIEEWQDYWTEEDGSYEMAVVNVPARDLLLWCVSDEHAPRSFGPFDLSPGEVAVFDFELEAARLITGVILDDLNLDPVDGADIQAIPLHPDMSDDDAWDVTFEDGTFEMETYSTPLDALWLHVYAEGHAPLAIKPLDPRSPLEIRLGPPQSLIGRVFDRVSEEPVPDVEVVLQMLTPTDMLMIDYTDENYVDEDGRFVIVPAYVPLSHAWVEVLADGYYPMSVPLRSLAPLEVSAGTFEVGIPLTPLAQG